MRIGSLLRKELKHLFYSPMAYVVSGIFLLITGWFFTNALFFVGEAELRGMMDVMPLLLMFFMPAITMRSLAEEKKVDTLQILMTLPVKEWEVILSKYVAVVSLFVVTLGFTLFYVFLLYLLGSPDGGMLFGNYLALFLLGCTYISIALFASTITSSQVIAFITGFSIIFVFFVLSRLQMILPVGVQSIVERFSMLSHFDSMLRGVVSLADVFYFLCLNIFFLMLSTYMLVRRKG